MTNKRRLVREKVMQCLYAKELGGGNIEQLLQNLLAPELETDRDNGKVVSFANSLFFKLIDNEEEVSEMIQRHTQNWDITRIALIDKVLLRIAITEFLFFEDIPPKVSINEAIDIAKQYSTQQSGKFINGVLDAVLSELRASNRLVKTGRGLIED